MHRNQSWWVCPLLLCTLLVVQSAEKDGTEKRPCIVYVLLDKQTPEHENLKHHLWTITTTAGCTIQDLFNERRSDTVKEHTLQIEAQGPYLYINGRRLTSNKLVIIPQDDIITFQDNRYRGKVYLLYQDATWHMVNGVDLEEYVYDVLRCESWPGWPLETNKVFAIVFRSYVVAKLLEARGKRRIGRGFLYDVLSTNAHQTYKGTHESPVLRQATEQTRSMILTYKNKPIEAMYDTCCGGIIPAHMKGINFESAPYLKRTYPCTYCATCKVYSWRTSYTLEEVAQLIHPVDATIKKIDHIKVSKKDKAGVVHELHVKSGKRCLKLSGRQAYSLFKNIKSFCFSVMMQAGKCLFEGDGYGHNIGLCQWGAHEMVKQGHGCTKILLFFYPGTRVMKLEVGT